MFGHYTRGEYEARYIKIVISGSDKILKITIREKTFSEISVFQFPKNFHFKKKQRLESPEKFQNANNSCSVRKHFDSDDF